MSRSLAARSALCVADALFLVAACLAVVCANPQIALAYVDPSVMTYTIQALAGVAVALSTVLGVAYRRIRKYLVRVLGIDENKGKVVDPDVERVSPDELEESDTRMGAFWRSAPDPTKAPKLGALARFGRALAVAFFTCGALLLLAPIELVVANSHSLTYNLGNVWVPIALFSLLASIVVALVLTALRGRAFDVACALVVAAGVCFWAQSLFLNTGLPGANGAPVEWVSPEYFAQTVESAIVWLAVFAVCVAFAVLSTKSFRGISLGVCSIFILITVIGAGSILLDPSAMSKVRDDKQVYVTEEGMFDLAPKDNVVVFILDMFDTKQFLNTLEQRPFILDEYTGFTFYPDSVGSLIPTQYAMPYLLTASWPDPDEPFAQYKAERYHRSAFLQDLRDSGYNLGVYTDTMGDRGQWREASKLTINQHPLAKKEQVDVDWVGAVTILAKAALYRDLPWLLKPGFWYYTDDINIAMTPGGIDDLASTPYIINDERFHNGLMKAGLSIDDRGGKGSFRLIHLNGAHWPYTLRPDVTTAQGSSYEDQAEGALNIVRDYMREMKRLGVYDDATVIVTSDHGIWDWNHDSLTQITSPIFMAKPAQGHGENERPCQVSDIQTGHIDFHATIMKAASGDPAGYGTSVFDAPSGNRERLFIYPLHDGKRDTAYLEYKIEGNALDLDSWSLSGNRWEGGK